MTSLVLRSTAIALLLAGAAPAFADAPPPPPPPGDMMAGPPPGGPGGRWGPGHEGMGREGIGRGMFASLSEAGRATMREAFRGGGDRRAEHDAVKAARDHMLDLLDNERLDTAALKRAMDDERNAANAGRERQQAAMLAAFTKLSLADRKAFVADARAMKDRMEQRMQQWRGRRGPGGDMPPPPPPPQ